MVSTALQYAVLLKMRLNILEDIRKNTVDQSDALERKDYDLLEKLLKERQRRIEKHEQIICCFRNYSYVEKNTEAEKLEQSIGDLVQEVISVNNANIKKAENQKSDLAGAVRNLKLGKHVIRNGYLKKLPQRYGYFIDKKVGR